MGWAGLAGQCRSLSGGPGCAASHPSDTHKKGQGKWSALANYQSTFFSGNGGVKKNLLEKPSAGLSNPLPYYLNFFIGGRGSLRHTWRCLGVTSRLYTQELPLAAFGGLCIKWLHVRQMSFLLCYRSSPLSCCWTGSGRENYVHVLWFSKDGKCVWKIKGRLHKGGRVLGLPKQTVTCTASPLCPHTTTHPLVSKGKRQFQGKVLKQSPENFNGMRSSPSWMRNL